MSMNRTRKFLTNCSLVVVTVAFALVCCEIFLRLATVGFEWRNYASAPINVFQMGGYVRLDPVLGYTQLPNRTDLGFGPIGNRINYRTAPNDPVPSLPNRPILALGDSFTYGSEVGPDESWPALLEHTLGVPVVNSGVGGYGIDQMVLFGERIVPIVKPRLIVLSFIPNDIYRVKASLFSGSPKAYFTVDSGALVLRDAPTSPPHTTRTEIGWWRAVLGNSYLVELTIERLGLTLWWHNLAHEYRFEDTDSVQVSCLLMARLKRLADRASVPAIVVGEYGWNDYSREGKSGRDQSVAVLNCARAQGLIVGDTFETMAALLATEAREHYYVKGVGHMTAKGNGVVADVIARLLRKNMGDLLH